SYRPITLLCIAGKILERIIKNRIELFAEPQKLLGANQFGFMRNRSTTDAQKYLQNAIDKRKKGEKAILVSLDIKSAFDNAWWPAILKTMDTQKYPAGLIQIVENYFSNRSISTSYGRYKASKTITKGCPQGSAL